MEKTSKIKVIFLFFSSGGCVFFQGIAISIMPPIFPKEAESKGASPSQYGFVFGIYFLFAIIATPLCTKFGMSFGLNNLICFGNVATGLTTIGFGCLTYVKDLTLFLFLGYLIRASQGMFIIIMTQPILSTLINIAPYRSASILAFKEMTYGFGYALGPAIGSWLYMVGGFVLPFVATGILILFCQVMLSLSLPKQSIEKDEIHLEIKKEKPSLYKFSVILPAIDNMVGMAGIIEAMLEPHARKTVFASDAQVGEMFLVMGSVYMICTPVNGFICDKSKSASLLSIIGNMTMLISFLIVGPVPFINLNINAHLIFGCMAMYGLAYSSILVSTFSRIHCALVKIGYEDDISTYFLSAGFWLTSFHVGCTVGSTGGGIMVDHIGFKWSILVFAIANLVMATLDFVEWIFTHKITFYQYDPL